MSHHGFDVDGWYVGLVDDDAPSSTPIAPPIDSTSTAPGEPRARWVLRVEWVVEPYAPPAAAVPEEVEMWRARCVLIAYGKLEAVQAAIAAIEDPVERALVSAQFEFRPTVRRDSELTQQLRLAAGITNEELDAMFIAGAAL